MQLTHAHLTEYQALYRTRFGRDISEAEALAGATKLLRLMEITYQPMTATERGEVLRRQSEL